MGFFDVIIPEAGMNKRHGIKVGIWRRIDNEKQIMTDKTLILVWLIVSILSMSVYFAITWGLI
jgi:hypothetical protein